MKHRIVVKVGSLAVTDENGGVNPSKIKNLIADLFELRNHGYMPILISSGAINSARGLIKKPDEKKMMISYQQALAAVGQPILMKTYIDTLSEFNWPCAQILVTHEDFKERKRFLNIRNTINRLLENGILPIVNENDTVSFEEITVGDNDQLAVMMTEASDADKLILLSEADGLFDKNPKEPDAIQFKEIDFRDDFLNVKIAAKTSVGRGGMDTKLKAVRKLTPLGIDVILGSYLHNKAVSRLLLHQGGTNFKGNPVREKSRRKSWLSTLVKNDCYVIVDDGASTALTDGHTSLLPVGIKKVQGKFKRGDVIQIRHKRKVLAIGLTEYDSSELNLIKGKKSAEINDLLEYIHSKVAIHKDNLLLKKDEL
ncbi:glutamate 5-kinase [Bacteriovorax sp. PP10]|uniref:Glutamate 5-kinase n=1 Tax=Bacteriovorax antarcticus TaxID=3088717 RepID=A0ABU5VQM2_9BACT|nr:glutamate 5-kinase [Bacteriovorax sp. PP10]MEA9355345.1 glutamate 5-kinase [Bacteriovorax sp. PP10]